MSILSLSSLRLNTSKLSSKALSEVSAKLDPLPVEPQKKSLFSNDFSNDFFKGGGTYSVVTLSMTLTEAFDNVIKHK